MRGFSSELNNILLLMDLNKVREGDFFQSNHYNSWNTVCSFQKNFLYTETNSTYNKFKLRKNFLLWPSDASDLGVGSNVVNRLTTTVPRHQNYKICFHNWFNSPQVVKLNHIPNSFMPFEKEVKKLGRGSMVEKEAVIDDVKLSLVS